MRLVAVTSCPTGIAHSEMAAEAIEVAARERGHEIEIEVQGASGAPPIADATIANAEAVIFAVDATVRDRDRFTHLPSVEVRTREAIDNADGIVERAEQAAEERQAAQPAAGESATADASPALKLVAVTSCPTGIAHSEMAAEAIEVAARERGHDIQVEVQGASGAPPIDDGLISGADAVIFAVDATVRDRDRFAGLPSVEVRTREAIDNAERIVERAEQAARERLADRPAAAATPARAAAPAQREQGTSAGEKLRRWLMTGVSYMIPFVVGGGILIALGFAIGGAEEAAAVSGGEGVAGLLDASPAEVGLTTYIGAVFLTIGQVAFSMLVPILAGFIAYAMADRPGIAPGIVGGLLANEIGAGFLGGLAAGLLAGWIVNLLKRIPVKGTLKRMLPILVYPIVGTFIVGAIILLIIGEPIAAATMALQNWLTGLSGTSEILLGIIVGAMMAFDLGGPLNKAAYAFGIAALDAGNFQIMAAIMAAGMVPPLALALATTIRSKLYNPAEKAAGEAAWLMGASFITEGAIPFAAADPLRVIPSMMIGSAVTAVLSLLFNATLQAPHGGLFVIGLVGNALMYLVAIAIGTVISAVLVNLAKTVWPPSATRVASDDIVGV